MSQENVEVVRRLYDAAARRESATVLSLYDPDVEWDGSRSRWAEVMPGEDRWRGHEALRSFFRRWLVEAVDGLKRAANQDSTV